MNTTVSRYSFYNTKGPGKTLRFDEVYPLPPHHEDHSVCGCTDTTQVRPEGEPDQISTGVSADVQIETYTAHIHVKDGVVGIRFRWEDPELEDNRGHASFRFHDDKMAVEVTGRGRGISDCTLGYVYFGNQTDTSKLVNGHMPSLMIDPASLSPDAVWVHESCWGFEAVSMLPIQAEETVAWRNIRQQALSTQRIVTKHLKDDVPVEDIHREISPYMFLMEPVIRFLLQVVRNPDDFDMIRRIMYVDTTASMASAGNSSETKSGLVLKIQQQARKARELLSK